jgi:HPt (histidine-containing phosphotransfer) domain-containing protein
MVITRELRAAYIASVTSKLAEFAEASAARHFRIIVRIGHQLKGSGRSYGIPEISTLGARIEEAGLDRRVSLLEPLLAEFRNLVNRITESEPVPEHS